MPNANDFITRLEEQARKQELAPTPSITQEDLVNRSRLIQTAKLEQERLRAEQPSYSEARKLFNKETPQQIAFDVRDQNALLLRQGAQKVDPVTLTEDLDGVFGGKNPLTKFLFGKGIKDEDLGKKKGFAEELAARGVLGFFTGELLRSTPETEANLYEVLLDAGNTPEEAFKKAQARVAGDPQVLTTEEVSVLRSYEAWDTAFKALDAGFLALDVVTLGVAGVVRPALKSAAREGVAGFVKEAAKVTNRNDLRKLVGDTYPELKGSQELEKMLDIVQEYPEDFSLLNARQDFQRTRSFNELAQTVTPTPVKTSTEAQRVIYQDGIPVIRRTTSDTLLARRSATMEAIKGNREALRLSNADVLAEEIQAGSLPFKTTADDTISVWRVAPRGRRVKSGEEVSLTESFAKSLSEGGKIEKVDVPLADLVRTADGTFTFAPERLIKESPTLKFPTNISKAVVKETQQKEADAVAKKLAKEKAEKETARKAAEEAERKLREPIEAAKARLKLVEEKPLTIKAEAQKQIVDLRKERDVAIKSADKKEIPSIKAAAQKKIIEVQQTRDAAIKAARQELKNVKAETVAIIKKASETATPVKETVAKPAKKVAKESLKPVGEGKVRESKLYGSTQERVREVRKELGETINTKEYEFYRVASNKDQLAKAASYIETNGVDKTIKALEVALRTGGDAVDGVLNNSLLIALEPELLKSGMAKKADELIRLASRLATRQGQELQILSVLDRNNPLAVLARLNSELDKLTSGSGILGDAAKKGSRESAEKEIAKLVDSVDFKSGLKQSVDDIVCK